MQSKLSMWVATVAMVCGISTAALADAPLAISGVKAEVKELSFGKDKGKKYIRVAFVAKANAKIEPKLTIKVKGVCKIGGETKTHEIGALGAKLDTLEVGASTKEVTVPLFMTDGVAAGVTGCGLSFSLAKLIGKEAGTALGEFCWDGSSVKDGACK